MTFKEAINRVSWAKIEAKMFAIYPEEMDSLRYYKRLYWTLCNLEAEQNPMGKIMQFELLAADEELHYENVVDEYEYDYDYTDDTYDEHNQMDEETWKKVLGYFLSTALLEEIDEAEIVAHAFVEAAYGGF